MTNGHSRHALGDLDKRFLGKHGRYGCFVNVNCDGNRWLLAVKKDPNVANVLQINASSLLFVEHSPSMFEVRSESQEPTMAKNVLGGG